MWGKFGHRYPRFPFPVGAPLNWGPTGGALKRATRFNLNPSWGPGCTPQGGGPRGDWFPGGRGHQRRGNIARGNKGTGVTLPRIPGIGEHSPRRTIPRGCTRMEKGLSGEIPYQAKITGWDPTRSMGPHTGGGKVHDFTHRGATWFTDNHRDRHATHPGEDFRVWSPKSRV